MDEAAAILDMLRDYGQSYTGGHRYEKFDADTTINKLKKLYYMKLDAHNEYLVEKWHGQPKSSTSTKKREKY